MNERMTVRNRALPQKVGYERRYEIDRSKASSSEKVPTIITHTDLSFVRLEGMLDLGISIFI